MNHRVECGVKRERDEVAVEILRTNYVSGEPRWSGDRGRVATTRITCILLLSSLDVCYGV